MANKKTENKYDTPCGKSFKYLGAYENHFKTCNKPECKLHSQTEETEVEDQTKKQDPKNEGGSPLVTADTKEEMDQLFGEKSFKKTPAIKITPPIKGKIKDKGKKDSKVTYTFQTTIFVMVGKVLNKLSESDDFGLTRADQKQLDEYLEEMGGIEVPPWVGIIIVLAFAWVPGFLMHGGEMVKNMKEKGGKFKESLSNAFNKGDKKKSGPDFSERKKEIENRISSHKEKEKIQDPENTISFDDKNDNKPGGELSSEKKVEKSDVAQTSPLAP